MALKRSAVRLRYAPLFLPGQVVGGEFAGEEFFMINDPVHPV